MYSNVIKQSFSSAHKIEGHSGKCAFLHGHNWVAEIVASCEELNDLGMGVDFADMKAVAKPVIDELDHCYLNELPYFQSHPPTAENVAKYIYDVLEQSFREKNVTIEEVVIWETEGCGVRYWKNKEKV